MAVYNKNACIEYFKNKYSYMEETDIALLYDIASDIYINLRFPFDLDTVEVSDSELAKHKTWLLRCMQEMIDKEGISNLVGYSENGVSLKFDKTGLSQSLIDEIVGVADIE